MKYIDKIKANHNNKGFTLLEIIAALVIVAILAAVAIPSLVGLVTHSKEKTCQLNRQDIIGQYQALTAMHGYYIDDADRDKSIEAIITDCGGKYIDSTHYTAPCGYDCTITYSKYNAYISSIICNAHGNINGSGVKTGITMAGDNSNSPANQIVDAISQAGINNKIVDSTSPSGSLKKEIESILGEVLSDFNVVSWKASMEGSTRTIYVTDQDISKYAPGDWVKVIRYNTARNTYTAAYVKIEEKTSGGEKYNIIPDGNVNSKFWFENEGQTADTKASFDETVKIFNTMTATR